MILFTCVISSLVTERSARRFALDENVQAEEEAKKVNTEQILIPVANPETIEDLINLALVIKDAKQKIGNKQCISHKFQPVHQRRYMRNQAIQYQARQESS